MQFNVLHQDIKFSQDGEESFNLSALHQIEDGSVTYLDWVEDWIFEFEALNKCKLRARTKKKAISGYFIQNYYS